VAEGDAEGVAEAGGEGVVEAGGEGVVEAGGEGAEGAAALRVPARSSRVSDGHSRGRGVSEKKPTAAGSSAQVSF